MENTRENNEKLQSLLSQMRHLVGDFDASSIFEKIEYTKEVCIDEEDNLTPFKSDSPHTQTAISDSDGVTRVEVLQESPLSQQNSPWTVRHLTSKSVSASGRWDSKYIAPGNLISSASASRSNVEDLSPDKGITAYELSDCDDNLGYADSATAISSHHRFDMIAGSMILPFSKYRNPTNSPQPASKKNIFSSTDSATVPRRTKKSAEKSFSSSDILRPSRRLFDSATPVKNINLFIEELPEDSPVRILL